VKVQTKKTPHHGVGLSQCFRSLFCSER